MTEKNDGNLNGGEVDGKVIQTGVPEKVLDGGEVSKAGLPSEQEKVSQEALQGSVEFTAIMTRVLANINQRVDQITLKIRKKLDDLVLRIEAKELDPDYEYDFLNNFANYSDRIFSKSDLGRQAIVLTYAEFDACGGIEIVLRDGETTILDPDSFPKDDLLVIYPWDLGDVESEE
jgi:hypothetical protein